MNKKIQQFGIVSGVALATLATAGAAQAALVVVPTDLAPGDQYRLVFVTDGTRDARSSNIDDYNTFVTNQATGETAAVDTALDLALKAAGFDPNAITWKAIGSTATVTARDNTGTNPSSTGVPIYLIDGNRVANNNADLWDGTINTAISITQSASILEPYVDPLEKRFVWTGSALDGGRSSFWLACGCGFGPWVTAGTFLSNEGWIDYILWSEHISAPWLRMYAMSSVLAVPTPLAPVSVPEHTSLIGYITLGCLMLGSAARKARK